MIKKWLNTITMSDDDNVDGMMVGVGKANTQIVMI